MEERITDYIIQYSYWAIIFGVMLEGDLTLLVAGMLAHEKLFGFGYPMAYLSALVGAVTGDLIAFTVGRRVRYTISEWKLYVKFYPRFEWLEQKFGWLSIFLVKYIYGLRFASSVFWGVSRMGPLRFLIMTALSCAAWVLAMTTIGYMFGTAISELFDRYGRIAYAFALAGMVAILLYMLHHHWISPTMQKEAEKAGFTQDLSRLSAPGTAADDELTPLPPREAPAAGGPDEESASPHA